MRIGAEPYVNPRIKKALPYLALIAIVVGFVNFFWFWAESAALGGDALNGYASGDHYYVMSHGSYTEVSQATWTWSRLHATSVLITHPIALASGAYLLLRFIFPSMMAGRTSRVTTIDRARRIRSSGPLLTSGRTAGQLGEVRFSGPLLDVSVFPGGLVIKPVFMNERAILASEIRDVTVKRGIFGQRIEIGHAGVDSISPFVLFGSGDSALVRAIQDVTSVAHTAPSDVESLAPEAGEQTAELVPAGIMATLGLLGIGVSIVMIGIGVFWVIPNLGLPGVIWTGFAVVIAGYNIRRLLVKR